MHPTSFRFRSLSAWVLIGLPLLLSTSGVAQISGENQQSEQIHRALEEVVANEKIPGMIAAITDSTGIIAIASAGIRKYGEDVPMTDSDLVHIGSCTKAMTSTLLAILIDEELLTWETTLVEVFPEFADQIHPDFRKTTLWNLVTHRAGLPANAKNWWSYPRKEIKERRMTILKETLKDAPPNPAGEYHYSNLGYMIAAAMAERLTGLSWEELITKKLFQPLGMTSAGFGPPGTKDRLDQPWGHTESGDSWKPIQHDNAESLGPAGRVHCTLEDWAEFIALQLPGHEIPLLDKKQLDKLIVPEGHYAAGWGVAQRSWAKGTGLNHNGSNTMWHATVWAAPNINRAFIVATNSKNESSGRICNGIVEKMIQINKAAMNK